MGSTTEEWARHHTDTVLIKGPFKRTQRDSADSALTDKKVPKRKKNYMEYYIKILFVYFTLIFSPPGRLLILWSRYLKIWCPWTQRLPSFWKECRAIWCKFATVWRGILPPSKILKKEALSSCETSMCFVRLKSITENNKIGRKRSMYGTDEQCM